MFLARKKDKITILNAFKAVFTSKNKSINNVEIP